MRALSCLSTARRRLPRIHSVSWRDINYKRKTSVYISFEWKRNNDGAKGKNEKIAPKFLYTWILIIEFSSPLHEWEGEEDGKRECERRRIRFSLLREHLKWNILGWNSVVAADAIPKLKCFDCAMWHTVSVCLFVQNIFVLNFKYCHIFNGNRKQHQQ